MDRRLPSVALALSAVLTACSPPAVDVEAEGEVLMQLSRAWSDLVATGDMDAINGRLGGRRSDDAPGHSSS